MISPSRPCVQKRNPTQQCTWFATTRAVFTLLMLFRSNSPQKKEHRHEKWPFHRQAGAAYFAYGLENPPRHIEKKRIRASELQTIISQKVQCRKKRRGPIKRVWTRGYNVSDAIRIFMYMGAFFFTHGIQARIACCIGSVQCCPGRCITSTPKIWLRVTFAHL